MHERQSESQGEGEGESERIRLAAMVRLDDASTEAPPCDWRSQSSQTLHLPDHGLQVINNDTGAGRMEKRVIEWDVMGMSYKVVIN